MAYTYSGVVVKNSETLRLKKGETSYDVSVKGTFNISGSADVTKVMDGGKAYAFSDATATDLTVSSGGYAAFQGNSTADNVTVKNGGEVQVKGNSKATNLTIASGGIAKVVAATASVETASVKGRLNISGSAAGVKVLNGGSAYGFENHHE